MTKSSTKKKRTTSNAKKEPAEIRLQKILADAGLFSRRKAEEAIVEGRIKVNGKTVKKLGTKVDPQEETITCDGKALKRISKIYLLMNKPAGVVCTESDPEGRKIVTSLVPEIRNRVFPVGRLDFNTTGLLLLTNDGDFAQKMMRPSSKVIKKYAARVRNVVENETIIKMKKGMTIEGIKYRFDSVKVERTTGKNSILYIDLTEGKKHHIKNLCKALGHPVTKLARTGYGPLKLVGLGPADYRHLSEKEVKALLYSARTGTVAVSGTRTGAVTRPPKKILRRGTKIGRQSGTTVEEKPAPLTGMDAKRGGKKLAARKAVASNTRRYGTTKSSPAKTSRRT